MKTVLVEPLNISDALLEKLSKPLKEGENIFESYDTKPDSLVEWLERVDGANQIILANSKMPKEVISKTNTLKYINIAFTGTDHVPVKIAKEKGVLVSNAAGYSDLGVAELVIGLTLSLLRNINYADKAVRNSEDSSKFLGREISGKTVGIIGTGNIGIRTAEVFKVFGAKLLGYSRSESDEAKRSGIDYVSLKELLEKSDIVSIHLPLNNSTRDFIGEKELNLMKKDSILINCARGPIVNSKALVHALNNGKIGGAGIDVFDSEPPIDKDEEILKAENTVLTPHIAFFTKESMNRRAHIVFKNAIDFLNGNEIDTLV